MPEKRIEKRKRKYLDYISLLKATGLTPKQAGDMDDFSRLLSSLDQYMDPENPKKIDKVTFAQVLNKYVAFQKKLESFEPSDAGKNVYEKFRKALAKDIRLFYKAIDNSDEDEFDLQDLFEQSRSVTLKVNEEDINKNGGYLSSRIRINMVSPEGQHMDGYFTPHTEFLTFKDELKTVFDEVSGNDPVKRDFFAYVLDVNSKNKSKLLTKYEICGELLEDNALHVRSKFKSRNNYIRSFKKALIEDLQNYLIKKNIDPESQEAMQLKDYVERQASDYKEIDKVINAANKAEKILNKHALYQQNKISNHVQIDKRNSAMSMVADLCGVSDVIAYSTNMRLKVGEKTYKGTFMQQVEGADISKFTEDNLFMESMPKMFEDPGYIKDMANIQIVDFICGNSDRHFGNFIFQYKTVNIDGVERKIITGVKGIDNDLSFGNKSFSNMGIWKNVISPEKLLIIPKETAQKVMSMNMVALKAMLSGYSLSKEQVQRVENRMNYLKKMIAKGREYYRQNPNAPLQEGMLKEVDDKEIAELSVQEDLNKGYYPVYDDNGNKMYEKKYNQFVMGKDVFETNHFQQELIDNNIESLEPVLVDADNMEETVINALERLKTANIGNFIGSGKYRDMLSSTKNLVDMLDCSFKSLYKSENRRKIINPVLLEIGNQIDDAIAKSGAYLTYKNNQLTREHRQASDREQRRLDAATRNREVLTEFKKIYDKFRAMDTKNKEILRDNNQRIAQARAEINEIKQKSLERKQRKIQEGIVPFTKGKVQEMINEDLEWIKYNVHLVKGGKNLIEPFNSSEDIILKNIETDDRLSYMLISSNFDDKNEDEFLDAKMINTLADKILADRLLSTNFDKTFGKSIGTDYQKYSECRNVIIDFYKDTDFWKNERKTLINTIRNESMIIRRATIDENVPNEEAEDNKRKVFEYRKKHENDLKRINAHFASGETADEKKAWVSKAGEKGIKISQDIKGIIKGIVKPPANKTKEVGNMHK